MSKGDHMRSQPRGLCHVCGVDGVPLYQGLRDRLFGTPGVWSVSQCPRPDCGLLWLDPMPVVDDLGRAYESYYTHEVEDRRPRGVRGYERFKRAYWASRYGLKTSDISVVERRFARVVAACLVARYDDLDCGFAPFADLKKGRLVEIGCGTGDMLKSFADWGWQVEGVDFDPVAVGNARGKGLLVRQGDLLSQQYPSNSFDAIFASHVIEHVPDPTTLMIECRRILRPGGRIAMLTPNANAWGHSMFREYWRPLEPPRHLHLFTVGSFGKMARAAGLSVEELRTSAHGAAGIFRMSRILQAEGHFATQRRSGLVDRLRSEVDYWREWIHLRTHSTSGEEIVFVGTRR